MSKKQKISKEKSIRRTRFITESIICCVLIAVGAAGMYHVYKDTKTVKQSNIYDNTKITEPTTASPAKEDEKDKVIYESSLVKTKSKFSGSLILVNEKYKYYGGGEKLVSVLEKNDDTGRDYLGSYDYTCSVRDIIYEPMAIMVDDFYNTTKNTSLTVWGGYRTTEFQQQLYDQSLAQTGGDDSDLVAKAGHSEHETGYAIDFSDVDTGEYEQDEDFKWINENCYKYGFIERYPSKKKNITNIQYEPWHFRYVGIPHAYYMTKNDLCMEEYIEEIKKYSYDGEHLKFTDDEKRSYEVYFVASDDGSENTTIPVPTGKKYDVSGNNNDGFIVTVYEGNKPKVEHKVTAKEEKKKSDTQQ